MNRAKTRYLHFLGERDDEALVEVNDAVDVDFFRGALNLAVGGEILRVRGRFLSQSLEKLAFDLGLRYERA